MKVISKNILYKYGDVIKVKVIQDTHIGSPLFDESGFKSYLSDVDDQTIIVGNGDVMDDIICTDKRYKKGVEKGDSEAIVDEQVDKAARILSPYKNHIVSLANGNHEETIIKQCSTNPIRRLCEKLSTDEHKVTYLGMKWMLRLNLRMATGRGRSIVIYGHHGYGGANRTEGGNITKFSRDMMYDEADIYLFGHVHEKIYKNIPRGYHGGSRYLSKDRLLIVAGSFKKNLTDDDTTTWEETKGFPIRAIGGVTIKIKPTNDWVKLSVDG
jgi:UDP-2,3-diacylglucosamine pyrophosphatase LpxH